ncbi:glutamine-hydrolyzing carbamoyl-phosphate synthase small subunit [Candidatus Altiarchaeota archaeon]
MKAYLALEDGSVIEGTAFGSDSTAEGELVFNTSMAGYVEALTDPSYAGQILMMTYPLIGNYGVARDDFESDGVKAEAFVVSELCRHPSNYRSQLSVDELLKEYDKPGIEGIDTRALTKKTREHGVLKAVLQVGDVDIEALKEKAVKSADITEIDLVDKVCVTEPTKMGEGGKYHVVLVDCGIKMSIAKNLVKRGVNLTIVPYDHSADDIRKLDPDGVFVSNGPGDPARVTPTINTMKQLLGEYPMSGICLGHQIAALSLGAKTYKMKFGHRGANQPVKDFESGRVFISSQNHGFAVDEKTLPSDMNVTQINLNDNTVEGMRHDKHPLFCVQYHPEASPGPHDTYFFFDEFIKMLK